MHTRSLNLQAAKTNKKQTPFSNQDSEITPKKQAVLVKLEEGDIQSTLHKTVLFESEMKLDTLEKDKRKPKRPWNPEEDDLLKELVLSKGAKEWAFISSYFDDRCGKQCRERWHNHLRNGIKKGDWTSEEEWILFLGVQAHGKRWSMISKMLEGRTQNTLKNHWNCKMKPKKEGLQRKLCNLMKNYPNQSKQLTKSQLFLIKLINCKPETSYEVSTDGEKNENKMRIKYMRLALHNFYEIKKNIYDQYQAQTYLDDDKFEEQVLKWGQVESFGKLRNEHEQKSPDKKLNASEIYEDGIRSHNESYQICRPFEIESNSIKFKINVSVKSASNMEEEIFDEDEDVRYGHVNLNLTEPRERNYVEFKSVRDDFCSPLKRNIFEGINLDQSNQKKRLFQ